MGVLAQVANEAILERHVIIELPFVGVVFQRPPAEVAAENFAAAIDGAEVLVRCGGVDIGHELLDDQLLPLRRVLQELVRPARSARAASAARSCRTAGFCTFFCLALSFLLAPMV